MGERPSGAFEETEMKIVFFFLICVLSFNLKEKVNRKMIEKKIAREINLTARRQWHQVGKPGELACGVVVHGEVKWFKAKVSERKSTVEGPVPINPVRAPKPAAARMAELADRAFIENVEISKHAY